MNQTAQKKKRIDKQESANMKNFLAALENFLTGIYWQI